jgi:CBS domain-containing protein
MKTVKAFMKRKIISVSPKTSLEEVWSLIFKKGIHALPVVDKQDKLLGIITEEDLLLKIYPKYTEIIADVNHFDLSNLENQARKLRKLTAQSVLQKMVFTTSPDDGVFSALSRMLMLHIRQLPVVNNKRQIVGMISKGDLFDYIFREYLLSS